MHFFLIKSILQEHYCGVLFITHVLSSKIYSRNNERIFKSRRVDSKVHGLGTIGLLLLKRFAKNHNARQFSVTDVLCVNHVLPLSLVQLVNQLVDSSMQVFSLLAGKGSTQQNLPTPKLCHAAWLAIPFTEVPFSSTVESSAIKVVQSKGFKPNEYIFVYILSRNYLSLHYYCELNQIYTSAVHELPSTAS